MSIERPLEKVGETGASIRRVRRCCIVRLGLKGRRGGDGSGSECEVEAWVERIIKRVRGLASPACVAPIEEGKATTGDRVPQWVPEDRLHKVSAPDSHWAGRHGALIR